MILSQVIGAATAEAITDEWQGGLRRWRAYAHLCTQSINNNHPNNLDNPIQILTDGRIYQKIRIRDKE